MYCVLRFITSLPPKIVGILKNVLLFYQICIIQSNNFLKTNKFMTCDMTVVKKTTILVNKRYKKFSLTFGEKKYNKVFRGTKIYSIFTLSCGK